MTLRDYNYNASDIMTQYDNMTEPMSSPGGFLRKTTIGAKRPTSFFAKARQLEVGTVTRLKSLKHVKKILIVDDQIFNV